MQFKTLSLPLIGSLLAATAVPALGQVQMRVASDRIYRQFSPLDISFRGGEFRLSLSDGSMFYQSGCDYPIYVPPTIIPLCPIGTTGFLIEGNPDPDPDSQIQSGPYYPVTSLQRAVAIEPRRDELCFLRAAPASTLPRPSGLFRDSSFAIYWNITTAAVAEYVITDYEFSKSYTAKQHGKMNSDIVSGVYQYTFPQLGRPEIPVAISSVIYPIPNGYAMVRNRPQGVRFTNLKKFEDGFQVLDPNLANTISWQGLGPGNVYPNTDVLYFSIRNLEEPDALAHQDANSKADTAEDAMFPAFQAPGEDKIILANPFVSKFVLPPGLIDTFKSGHKGVVELELQRSITTNGVSYDLSSRKFQLPIKFVDRYKNFAKSWFRAAKKKTGLNDDFDGDGALNFEEWALHSNPTRFDSKPLQPEAAEVVDENFSDLFGFFFGEFTEFYGFRYPKRHDLVPAVTYIFEQSNTATGPWTPLVSDPPDIDGDILWAVAETEDEVLVSYNALGPVDADGDPLVPRYFRVRVVLTP